MLRIGTPAPDFEAPAYHDGEFTTCRLADHGGRWVVMLFYPLDFTFVCPTEILAFSDRLDDFLALGADVLGLSVDSQYTHRAWAERPRREGGVEGIRFPLLADVSRQVCGKFDVLTAEGVALRALLLIDPEGIVQHVTMNNLAVGRSVEETLRVLQAFQLARESGEVCPANWTPGAATMHPDTDRARAYFAREHAAA